MTRMSIIASLPRASRRAAHLLPLLILTIALLLLPCAACAEGESVTATAAVATQAGGLAVKGMQFLELDGAQVPIELDNCAFNAIPAGTDISGWFTNLPVGLTATVAADVPEHATSATAVLSGFPSARSKQAIEITIPKACIAGGDADVAVTPKDTAKYDIMKANYTLYFAQGKLLTGDGRSVSIPGWKASGNRLTLSGKSFETTADIALILDNNSTVEIGQGAVSLTGKVHGLYCDQGNVVIVGCGNNGVLTVIASGKDDSAVSAICAGNLRIQGAKIIAKAGSDRSEKESAGIYADDDLRVFFSDITAYGISQSDNNQCDNYCLVAGGTCEIWNSGVSAIAGGRVNSNESIGVKASACEITLGANSNYLTLFGGDPVVSVRGRTRAFSQAPSFSANMRVLGSKSDSGTPKDAYQASENDAYKSVLAKIPPNDPQPNAGSLMIEKLTLGMGKSVKAYNLVAPDYAGGVTWRIDDESIIQIKGKGKNAKIKPLKAGKTLVTAIFDNNDVATLHVAVVGKGEAASKLTLKGKLSMKVGGQIALEAVVGPDTALDKSLVWYSSNGTIATVDQRGTVTALNKGKCKIYALTTGGVRKVVNVTVRAK